MIGALIVQAVLGTVYAFSVFVKPLESEFGWSRLTTQWAFSFALLTFAFSMIPAGKLQDRIGPRKVATIGGILLGLSFMSTRPSFLRQEKDAVSTVKKSTKTNAYEELTDASLVEEQQ